MGLSRLASLLPAIAALTLSCSEPGPPAGAERPEPGAGTAAAVDDYGDRLGTIEFPVSCNAEASPLMERGLALLHHMTYAGAEAAFSKAAQADPDCALARWGIAMSYVHPLWSDPPSVERLQRGLELLREAEAITNQTARETGYIAATLAYYDGAAERLEPESLERFRDGWERVYREFPEDIEAASFYALALMATAEKSDKTLRKEAEAGQLVEQVLAKVPDHPAAHHYIIHAYDNPTFADRALEVARNYGNVAPEVPHALHMPTHIFTRLGHWDDSIDMNSRSAAAAEASAHGEYVSAHMLHAQDYLVYAHLQKAEEQQARAIVEQVMELQGPWGENARGASAYALAAMPARFALERRDWAAAATIEPRLPASFPWSPAFAQYEALSWFGRGLGAARADLQDIAAEAVSELNHLREVLQEQGQGYWAKQVEIQARSIEAWAAYAGGETELGLERMQAAAELENSTDKHPITPGEVLPANELYGDMLLEAGRAEDAIAAYRASLARSPNRFNSLYGVGEAASSLGDDATATAYYSHLAEMTAGSGADWPRLQAARAFLAAHEGGSAGP